MMIKSKNNLEINLSPKGMLFLPVRAKGSGFPAGRFHIPQNRTKTPQNEEFAYLVIAQHIKNFLFYLKVNIRYNLPKSYVLTPPFFNLLIKSILTKQGGRVCL